MVLDGVAIDESEESTPNVNIDFDDCGRLVGNEVLNTIMPLPESA